MTAAWHAPDWPRGSWTGSRHTTTSSKAAPGPQRSWPSNRPSLPVTHYPHPTYDNAGLTVAGDYESHRNIANGATRDTATERLYLLDRT